MEGLKCDICGGKLVMQANGLAKCESCGMEYSKERIQNKVQEIKGTVSIVGAVETVHGATEKERLLKNAETYLSLEKYDDAKNIFNLITKEYPDDYRGWWGICRVLTRDFINPYDNPLKGFDWVPTKDLVCEYYELARKDSLPDKNEEIYNCYIALRTKQDKDRLELCYKARLRPHEALDIDGKWRNFIDLEDILKYFYEHKNVSASDMFLLISNLFWDKKEMGVYIVQGALNAQEYRSSYGGDDYPNVVLRQFIDKSMFGDMNLGEECQRIKQTLCRSKVDFIMGKTISIGQYGTGYNADDYEGSCVCYENRGKEVRSSIKSELDALVNKSGLDPLANLHSNSKKSGCYIATAVYGSYECPEVWTLRRFRDNKLATTCYGRAFIKVYYAISPSLVKWFGKTKWFNRFWKDRLDKLVYCLHVQGISDTPYQD